MYNLNHSCSYAAKIIWNKFIFTVNFIEISQKIHLEVARPGIDFLFFPKLLIDPAGNLDKGTSPPAALINFDATEVPNKAEREGAIRFMRLSMYSTIYNESILFYVNYIIFEFANEKLFFAIKLQNFTNNFSFNFQNKKLDYQYSIKKLGKNKYLPWFSIRPEQKRFQLLLKREQVTQEWVPHLV